MKMSILNLIIWMIFMVSIFKMVSIFNNHNINRYTVVKSLKRDNKQILLVGVRHIGNIEYYKKIQNILDTCSVVFFEGVDMENKPNSLSEKYLKMADSTGEVYQGEVMEYKSIWYCSDLKNSDMAIIFNNDEWIKECNESKDIKKINNAVIDLRNDRVILDVIDKMKISNNITIFYGNSHIDNFIEEFGKMGFEVSYEEKIYYK